VTTTDTMGERARPPQDIEAEATETPAKTRARQERPQPRVTPAEAQAVLRAMQAGLLRKG
jgi:hypothetical protein